ncbi:TetR/AcrR family transcriptional regulator [Jatrophihabitans sp. YIM 134969]
MTGTTARPRQRLSAAERREQLFAAAVEVLAEHGFGGASADAIARRAGISKGLLWHYFEDRDDLFEQTARRTLKTLLEAVGAAIDLTAPAPEVIRAAVHGAAGLRLTHGAERRAMNEIILNLRREDGSLRLGVTDFDDAYAAQAAIFRRGQAEGDIRPDLDPLVLAVTYQGAVDGMLGYLDAHPDADATSHADTVADVLLAGVRS